jgi:hypothetical protein
VKVVERYPLIVWGGAASVANGAGDPPRGADAPPGGRRHPFVTQFLRSVRADR